MVSYFLYRIAAFFIRFITEAAALRSASFIAFLFYIVKGHIRRNVKQNFEVMGIKDGSSYSVFKNFSRTIVDLLRLPSMSKEELQAKCTVRGIEHLDNALEKSKGAVLFTPHLGPWEIAGATLAAYGYSVNTVALEHPSSRVTKFFGAIREKWGIRDYPPGECIGSLIKSLRNNETVVLLIDRNFSTKGLNLPLFGREALLPNGHIILSMRTEAPLLPCWCYYNEQGTIDAFIGKAIAVAADSNSPESIGKTCLEQIQEYIAGHPEQWFAFDHLWPEETYA